MSTPNTFIAPTIGRVVWFHPDPRSAEAGFAPHGDSIKSRGAAQPYAAIVAHVWSDSMVNLTVFDANGMPHSRTSVCLIQGDEPRPEAAHCEWMPFQKGQAKAQVETKIYADGVAASSTAPLPDRSPAEQDVEGTAPANSEPCDARPGDLVRLKSGGHLMTAGFGSDVFFAHPDGGNIMRDHIPSEVLEVVRSCPKLPALEDAIVTLRHAMQDDLEYAWAWHCNIAVPLRDALGQGTISHEQSNLAAARLLRHLFDVDITDYPHYAATQALEAEPGPHLASGEGGTHEAVDAVFAARRDCPLLDFGAALHALKHGERVARLGWNGKGMFVYMVPAASYPAQTGAAKAHFGEGSMVPYNAYFALKGVDGAISTWVPSINDSLAEDWILLS
ncbi:Thoeris anti-defense Tad2 family protein [Variovorax sp.]|uniref:Thoeris anti-defense Tad2 family protein n=1 Tax=Variovorax sp. TaxID=1871043 RepID=UPI003BAD5C7B